VVQQMVKEAGGIVMPTLPLGQAKVEALINLLESESKLARSQFAGQVVSERVLGPADIKAGVRIFLGRSILKAGGPACFSCHTVEGMSGLGGGSLGPDLTKVFERLGGRKGLTSWLGAPATPTMQATFAQHGLEQGEVESLVAYFQAKAQFVDPPPPRQVFVGLGLAGACLVLWGLNMLWKKRLRGVRRAMVQNAAIKG
jgi:mono/diheme cytochrome c family protein